jgi:hypothetical protein
LRREVTNWLRPQPLTDLASRDVSELDLQASVQAGGPGNEEAAVSQRSIQENELIISYMFLRKIVGWIGSLLPIVLILGGLLTVTASLPESMSGYYYTQMRNVFVGALCALGIFLVGYAGYDDVDRWITNVAGLGAIGVAFLPTKPPVCALGGRACLPPSVARLSMTQQIVGDAHLCFAAVTFIALGVMALRFAKSEETPSGQLAVNRVRHGLGLAKPSGDRQSPRKRIRNVIYRICGIAILSCVALAALSNVLPMPVSARLPLLFSFEALAVFAFGISWFVKGQTLLPILKDREPPSAGPEPEPEPERRPEPAIGSLIAR